MAIVNIVFLACALFTAVAAYCDWRTGHIPNRLIVIGLVSGIALHCVVQVMLPRPPDQGVGAVLASAAASIALGLFACAVVPLVLYRMGAIGGGDVKLLIVLGAFLGPATGLEVELYSFVVIALYAPAQLAYRGQLFRLLSNSALILANPFLRKEKRRAIGPELLTSLRFGPAIALASALVCATRWSGS